MSNGSKTKQTESQETSLTESKPLKKTGKEAISNSEIARSSVLDDIETLDTSRDIPVVCLEDPDTVIPYTKLTPYLTKIIIENYGEKFLKEKVWTVGIIRKLGMSIGKVKDSLSKNIAQICGPNCTYSDLCPHNIVGLPPVGERCPQELTMMNLLFEGYLDAVAERLDADKDELRDDIIYHNLVMGLVETDILSMRLDGSLAKDGFITSSVSAINEETGDVFYKDEEAIAIRVKDRVFKRKDQLYRQLLATPEMAEKYKKKGSSDMVSKGVDILNRMEDLVNHMSSKNAIEAEIIDDKDSE